VIYRRIRRLAIGSIASIALQYGADVETIRKGLSRDSRGRATSPVGAALDRISEMEGE
jgi:hypothetical protein